MTSHIPRAALRQEGVHQNATEALATSPSLSEATIQDEKAATDLRGEEVKGKDPTNPPIALARDINQNMSTN